jgi:superoxide dismutase, Fe-Mn family
MDDSLSRRDVLIKSLPTAAIIGAGMSSALFAQAADNPAPAADPNMPVVGRMIADAHQNGQYSLPKLPYEYDALEPHIDVKTMTLHHSKHHQAYVTGLNNALKNLADLRAGAEIDAARLSGLQRDLSFNGGGHTLHTIFWASMAPKAGGEPQGPFAEAINKNFGSFAAFQAYFTKVAAGVKGSGWAVLSYEPVGDNLVVFEINEHDTKMIAASIPLLPLDVWEHAYYLKYNNVRADYIKAWWNVVNWTAVAESYQWARSRFQSHEVPAKM